MTLKDYTQVAPPGAVDVLERLAERMHGRSMLHVNSTRVGGGVVEMLERYVPLFSALGLYPRWEVLTGAGEFFRVTKAFHNALQGQEQTFTDEMLRTYVETNRENASRLDLDADVVFIHDPQPAAMIEFATRDERPWVWRCHIDMSQPQEAAWQFLRPYISKYNAAVFSLQAYAQSLPIPQHVIRPSIDPLTEKNRALSGDEITEVLTRLEIPRDKPLLVQVSRFDRFKDPVGVIHAYRLVKHSDDCRLVLAGGGADDDPEGAEVLAEVQEAADGDQDIHVLVLPPTAKHEINALQRAATIIIQKSTREGFGLTVTEGMWKGKPVIGGTAGGITAQIIDGVTGYLVNSVEDCAFRIRYLLHNPETARHVGENAREFVRENFLITRDLADHLVLVTSLLK